MTGHWSDSEIWSIQIGKHCGGAFSSEISCWSKPLFHWVTRIGTYFFDGLNAAILVARSLVLVCWGICFWLYFYSRKNQLLLLTFISSSFFLLDSAYFRSDFLALPFVILHAQLLTFNGQPSRPLLLKAALFATSVIAILMTPKSILWLLCLLPFYWSQSKKMRFGFAGFYASLILFLFIKSPPLLDYVRTTLDSKSFGFSLWSISRFDFVFRAIIENPHFVLAGAWISAPLINAKENTPVKISVLLLILVFILFPEKLPFWISAHLFLVLFVMQIDQNTSVPLWKSQWVVPSLLFFSILFAGRAALLSKNMTAREQQRVIHELEKATSSLPYVRIYDTTGLLPRFEPELPYLGPAEDARSIQKAINNIRTGTYDVVIITNKLSIIRNDLAPALFLKYCPLSEDIWVRAEVDPDADRFKSHLNALTVVKPCPARLTLQLYTPFTALDVAPLTSLSMAKLFRFEPKVYGRWQPDWHH